MRYKYRLPFLVLLAALAVPTLLPASATAGPTYTYTGAAMDLIVGNASLLPAGQDHITGSVTFDDSVTAGFSGDVDQTQITAASLSAFGYSLNLSDPTQPEIGVTMLNGVVTSWGFSFYDLYTSGSRNILLASTSSSDIFAHFSGAGSLIDVSVINDVQTSVWVLQDVDVPEPLSAALLLAGLGGLTAGRRRRANAAPV
jgi:hypothetical protein